MRKTYIKHIFAGLALGLLAVAGLAGASTDENAETDEPDPSRSVPIEQALTLDQAR